MRISTAARALNGSYNHANVIHLSTNDFLFSLKSAWRERFSARFLFHRFTKPENLINTDQQMTADAIRCGEGRHVLRILTTFYSGMTLNWIRTQILVLYCINSPSAMDLLMLLSTCSLDTQRNNLNTVLNTQPSLNGLFFFASLVKLLISSPAVCMCRNKAAY